jgi:hypothetical protein
MIVGPLLEELDRALTAAGIRIVHLKVIAQSEAGYVKAALIGNGREPAVEGALEASPAEEHDVLVNLRALGAPEQMRDIVERAFAEATAEWQSMTSFRPSAPVPYYRTVVP